MKTKRLNKGNHLAYKFLELEQAQKAVMYCNAMGLTVTDIDFSRIKPTLRVMHNKVTEQMLVEDKAIIFKHGSDDKAIRYSEGQFMVEGIRTIFRVEDIDIQPKRTPTEIKH